jgi:hypothetical protein
MQGGSQYKKRPLNVDEWLDFAVNRNGLKHYASHIKRPGHWILMGAVEYLLFPPKTPSNENFHQNLLNWKEAAWNVFSVPQESHKEVVRIASALAMQISNYPPAMLFLGASTMIVSMPPTASEQELKAVLVSGGTPKEIVDLFSGLEKFPGKVDTIHAVENDERMLREPLRPEELSYIRGREEAALLAMSYGMVPPLKEIAEYVYGKGRVLSSPGPR